MPLGLASVFLFPPATRRSLARHWKARHQTLYPILNAQISKRQLSSIADVMLGRATKAFVPAAPKNDSLKQSPSLASSNGNIREQFKKSSQSQSLSNFVSPLKSRTDNAVAKPTDLSNVLKRKSAGSGSSVTVFTSASGFSSVCSKQDAFRDTVDHIDLTQDSSSCPIPFNEDDFEDDADIDLDLNSGAVDILPKTLPSKLYREKATHTRDSPFSRPQLPRTSSYQDASGEPASSLQTWSSSPPHHKLPPPGALARKEVERSEVRHIDIDVEKPTKKRRILPWSQDQTEGGFLKEEDEKASSLEDLRQLCTHCRTQGHHAMDCPDKPKDAAPRHEAITPRPRKENVPWNTTASAVKEQQRLFKNKQKLVAKKQSEADIDVRASHPPPVAAITLSDEQSRVLDLVVNNGKSVFFTGSAGTGKSVLMRAIISELKKKYIREPDKVAVTASTGLAACNIGGVTLHSFGGIGLGKEDVPTLVRKIRRNANAKNRWIKTKVLIIDEISMVDGDLFDKLEGIARTMKNNGRPFGGIQLVITGDFFQLPPVPDFDRKSQDVKFAFDANTWSTSVHHTIGLTEVFRQKDPGKLYVPVYRRQ